MKTSVIAVLLASNGLGAIVKGITGFGSAIINLCVWIVATCAGIDAGTLQQAVLTECICSEALAIPLLFLTRAHVTCDWALVLSLSIFGAVGAPVGAAMLTHLPPRQVEFAVGCLMLLVILLNLWRKAHSKGQGGQPPAGSSPACKVEPAPCGAVVTPALMQQCSTALTATAAAACSSSATGGLHSMELRALPQVVSAGPDQRQRSTAHRLDATLAADAATGAVHSRSSSAGSSITSQHRECSADARCVCILPSPEQQQQQLQDISWADAEGAPLLPRTASKMSGELHCRSSTASPGQEGVMAADATGDPHPGLKQRVRAWWVAAMQPERLAAFRRMLLMGSLAGSASGVMAGLTGMGGPPVMLMFEKLQVPKDTVRGTSAVCNAIQLRIFAYIAMGVFSRADLPLYIASCSAALVGMFVGCSLAGRTNQANFSRMLSALMVLCCVLMFASAAGVAGNTVAVKHTNS